MRLFLLGPRLQTAADFIPPGAVVADIGTDHARLPIWLVQKGIIAKAIASDINAAPLARARENVAFWGVSEQINLLQGAGFEGIAAGEFTHGVICGMGGDTIIDILRAAPFTACGEHRLILQAESAVWRLRAFLYEHGYTIEREIAVVDHGRLYSVMEVRGGQDTHRDDPLYTRISYPLTQQRDEAAVLYFRRVRKALAKELQGMSPGSGEYLHTQTIYRRIEALEAENAGF